MIDKSKLLDVAGRPLTQSLFLEIGYTDYAVYTLKEYDHTHKGVLYPSLKKLFLKEEDPTEYSFAEKHLLGWQHWKRLCENKAILAHVTEWREELELRIRSQAVKDMISMCANEGGNYSASKYLADRGWEKRGAGRPSKTDIVQSKAIAERVEADFAADVARMDEYRKKV
jgi:hypothetical protein